MGSVRLCHTNSEFQRKNSVQFNNFIIKKVGLEGLENYKTLVSRPRPYGQDQDLFSGLRGASRPRPCPRGLQHCFKQVLMFKTLQSHQPSYLYRPIRSDCQCRHTSSFFTLIHSTPAHRQRISYCHVISILQTLIRYRLEQPQNIRD